MSESQKKILTPDIQESEDEDIEEKETSPKVYRCEQNNNFFYKKDKFLKRIKTAKTA